jgi:hypothetical protein
MKRFAQLAILSFAVLAASPLIASAQFRWSRQQPATQAPELDPNSAAAALALLIGSGLLIHGRRRRAV